MKVANIVYENELVNHKQVSYINYVKHGSDDYFDVTLPTLYVGWVFLKKQYSHLEVFKDLDILNKTILKDELYWEFSFEENKSEHINGVEDFVNWIPFVYFSSNYRYENINPIYHKIYNIQDLLSELPSDLGIIYNLKDEFLYITHKKTIIGIDLTLFRFFDFDVSEIIFELEKKSKHVFNDLDEKKSKELLKPFNQSFHLKKYLPILLNK